MAAEDAQSHYETREKPSRKKWKMVTRFETLCIVLLRILGCYLRLKLHTYVAERDLAQASVQTAVVQKKQLTLFWGNGHRNTEPLSVEEYCLQYLCRAYWLSYVLTGIRVPAGDKSSVFAKVNVLRSVSRYFGCKILTTMKWRASKCYHAKHEMIKHILMQQVIAHFLGNNSEIVLGE